MNFARWLFRIAGLYGLVMLLPQYFMEHRIAQDYPPAITHPEYFYGFLGVGVAWQVAFLIIARDPLRYRRMILPAVLEKFSFGMAAIVLFSQGRIPTVVFGCGIVDLAFGVLFLFAEWSLGMG